MAQNFGIANTLAGFKRVYDKSTFETLDVYAPLAHVDDFTHKTLDTTNGYTVAGVNSGTAAINVAVGGTVRLTTGAADDDDVDLATDLIFKAEKGLILEARFAQNDIAATAFALGFSDATGEGADLIAFTFATTSLTTTASDAVLFFADSDATSNVIRAAAVKANTDSSVISTAIAPVNAAFHIYRIEVSTAGDCAFYMDGVLYGTAAAAVTTTVALCAYVGVINREGAANTFDLDYLKIWSGR
jgi:hypothetical protein